MDIRLQVFKYDADDNNYLRRSFRFAVVDFSKSKSYPSNFVCMLPAQLAGNSDSVFLHVFGDKSLEQAKALLKGALEGETDSEVKAEIERRLKLLEPKGVNQIKCSGCGKLFQPRRARARTLRNSDFNSFYSAYSSRQKHPNTHQEKSEHQLKSIFV